MFNRFYLLFLPLALTLLFVSCDDSPTDLGSNLLPKDDLINTIKVNSTDLSFDLKSKFYATDSLSLSTSSMVFLGKSGNVESTMLLKFYRTLPDSIKKAIEGDSLTLTNAVLEMKPRNIIGDVNSPFKFSIHEITSEWKSFGFGLEELEKLEKKSEDAGSNYKTNVGKDSLITADINKTLVNNWLKLFADEKVEGNEGIYLDFAAETNKLVGFPAISSQPDSLLTRLKLYVKVGKKTDTLSVSVIFDVHVVKPIEIPAETTQNLFLQGGIPIRSNLFFDVSAISADAIINKATLKLFLNKSESMIGTDTSKNIVAIALEDFEKVDVATDALGALLSLDSLAYSGDATKLVQKWVSDENNGVKLSLLDEATTLNKIALYGINYSDLKLRPYLEIIYTSKN